MATNSPFLRAAGVLALLCLAAPAFAQTDTIDFSQFDPGETIDTFAVCEGDVAVAVRGENPACPALNAAIVFDSNCSGAGCSGNDPDLGVNLGNLLIVHEHCDELDGFVEDPDDEAGENEVFFTFSEPITFCEYTAIDNEFEVEIDNGFFYSDAAFTDLIATSSTPFTSDGGVVDVSTFSEENGSGAINEEGCVEGVESIRFFRRGSRGLTNLDLVCPQDTTPPICGPIVPLFEGPNGKFSGIASSASDAESGIASVLFTRLVNMQGFVDGNGPFAQGETYVTPDPNPASVSFTGQRINFSAGGSILVTVMNGDGLTAVCDPVVDRVDAAAPETFGLASAYPNPFRASDAVRIPFRVAETSDVRVAVYDVLGREIARLVDGPMEPGSYEASWTARDLPAGSYTVRLTAGTAVQTQRITLLH